MSGELKNVTAREILSLVGGKTDILEGSGSIEGSLRLTGRDTEELKRSAAGAVSIQSRDGVIRKWNLISKLLALTNVYDLLRGRIDLTREGMVFRKLSASFEGKNGVFHTNNFLVDSPSMIITGRGDFDVAQERIDGKMTASPLVAMDSLIGRIPVFRDVFKEKESGFLFFVYDVKGPAKDPEVRSSYVQSVGTRVFNIFRNTLQLPKEVLEHLPKEKTAN
jgi:uncharacterized protein YhdP